MYIIMIRRFQSLMLIGIGVLITLVGIFAWESYRSQAQTIGGCQTFPETNHMVCGKFLDYWQSHGGLASNGYPISEPFSEVSQVDGKLRIDFNSTPRMAGTLAHWAWFTLARTLPVAISSTSSLPVPIVGVFAGMLVLGERPGITEFVALGLVVSAIAAVLWPPKTAPDD
jgi:hypothetical protein